MTVTPDTIRQVADALNLKLARAGGWFFAYEGARLIACVADDEADSMPNALPVIAPPDDPIGIVSAEELCRAVGTVEDLTTACPCGGSGSQQCDKCKGIGETEHRCSECDERHEGRCAECDGRGKVECDCTAGRERRPLAECLIEIGPHLFDRFKLATLVRFLAGDVTVRACGSGALVLANEDARVVAMRVGNLSGDAPRRLALRPWIAARAEGVVEHVRESAT